MQTRTCHNDSSTMGIESPLQHQGPTLPTHHLLGLAPPQQRGLARWHPMWAMTTQGASSPVLLKL